MDTPTPRTDENQFDGMMIIAPISGSHNPCYATVGKVVVAPFARQLERELIAALAKIEEMETDAYNSMVERSLRDHD